MLHRLHLKNVGPAPELALDPLARRLNLITGDNGLGKSFLLDVVVLPHPAMAPGGESRPDQRGHGVAEGSPADGRDQLLR